MKKRNSDKEYVIVNDGTKEWPHYCVCVLKYAMTFPAIEEGCGVAFEYLDGDELTEDDGVVEVVLTDIPESRRKKLMEILLKSCGGIYEINGVLPKRDTTADESEEEGEI